MKRELRGAGTVGKFRPDEFDGTSACLDRELRAPRGWQKPQTLDKTVPDGYAPVSRAVFYSETESATDRATTGIGRPRWRRLADRRAINETMVRFDLIEVAVGGRTAMVPGEDRIS